MKKNAYLKIRRSAIQGRGAVAIRTIRKGTKIIEYTGEHISPREADARYNDQSMTRHHTFLFDVTPKTCIDGNRGGSDARFINHSCEPNCEALDEHGRIFIFAATTIRPGDELTYDYCYKMKLSEKAAKKHYPCRCGSEKCRGTIVQLPRRKSSR